MAIFELGISSVGSDYSAICATTIGLGNIFTRASETTQRTGPSRAIKVSVVVNVVSYTFVHKLWTMF